MIKYDGMSYVQPYYNKGCTRPLQEENNVYKFDMGLIASNALNMIPISIWIRNDGSHKAYSIKATCSDGEVQNLAVVGELEIGQVKRIIFNLNISGGYIGTKTYDIAFEYDSL